MSFDVVENFFMGMDEEPEPAQVTEPWRCSACVRMIYNIAWEDGKSYPRAGAPIPKYVSENFPMVCSLCYELWRVPDRSVYWRALPKGRPVILRTDQWVDFI